MKTFAVMFFGSLHSAHPHFSHAVEAFLREGSKHLASGKLAVAETGCHLKVVWIDETEQSATLHFEEALRLAKEFGVLKTDLSLVHDEATRIDELVVSRLKPIYELARELGILGPL